MNSRLLLFLALIIFFSSCKKDIVRSKSKKTADINIEEIEFDYFTTKTKVKYSEGDKQVNGTANIRIKKDSLIWISISPSIGIEASRITITKDTAIVINRIEKEYYVFTYDEISRYFNFRIDYNMIQAILLGNLVKPAKENTKIAKEGQYFLIKQKSDHLDIQSYILSDNKKIETVLITEDATNNFMTLKYGDYKETGAYLFARNCLVNLTYKANKGPVVTSINLQHNKADISDKPLKFPFNIPDKYEAFK